MARMSVELKIIEQEGHCALFTSEDPYSVVIWTAMVPDLADARQRNRKVVGIGVARCSPKDTFDVEFGLRLAESRAKLFCAQALRRRQWCQELKGGMAGPLDGQDAPLSPYDSAREQFVTSLFSMGSLSPFRRIVRPYLLSSEPKFIGNESPRFLERPYDLR